MQNILLISVFITGISGIVAQTLLIRELLVVFEGNELSLGLILGNWLILEATGSYLVGKKIEYIKDKILNFVVLQILFSLSFFISVWLTRSTKLLLKIPFGVSLGVDLIFLITILILFFPSIIHGALFTYSAKILQQDEEKNVVKISKVYIFETLGTIFGGIIFTYILIKFFSSFQIVFIIFLLNILSCIALSFINLKNKKVLGITSLTSFLFFVLIFFNLQNYVEKKTISKFWSGQEVIYYKNSIYNNIVVTKQNQQYNFFVNSYPIFSVPYIDKMFVEEVVHIPLSIIKKPKRVLILGKGAGGIINELLKYENLSIDYIELDKDLLETFKILSVDILKKELNSLNVSLYYLDGCYFLKNTETKYDFVFIGFSEPKDLQINRFFTLEFFKILKSKISDEGIVTFQLPGSYVYLSKQLAELNKCVISTAKNVFKFVNVLPGDYNIILCSNADITIHLAPEKVISGLKEKNILVDFLNEKYLEYRLNKEKINWFNHQLEDTNVKLNYSFLPSAVFYSINYWTAKLSPKFFKYFNKIQTLKEKTFIFYLLVSILILTMIIFLFTKNSTAVSSTYIAISTGCVSMLLNLTLIFSFQVLYGYIYYQIALLSSFFMLGSILGAYLAVKHLRNLKLMGLEIFILLLSVLFFLLLKTIKDFSNNKILYFVFPYIFLILSVLVGSFSGIEFPILNKILIENSVSNISSIVGKIYAFDLLGGWVGAILGSIVIFPIFGIKFIFYAIIILKITSLILLRLTSIYERQRI